MTPGRDCTFRPVTLGDRPIFSSHYALCPPVHSDNTFTNMVCWNHYAHYEYTRCGRCLMIRSTIDGETAYRPPSGPRDRRVLKIMMELAASSGAEIPLVLIDQKAKEWIEKEYPGIQLHPEYDYFEYVYRTSDLAELPGKRYLTIRGHLNRFRKNCHPHLEVITGAQIGEVRDFLVEWCEWKDCMSVPFLMHEKDAVFYAIDHFLEIGISGLLIRVAGKVGAIALFDELNPSTAVVHFEKGLPDCEGIYKAINAETARFLTGRYAMINRESDMGVEGLREAKMRYHPDHLVEVWYARSEDIAAAIG